MDARAEFGTARVTAVARVTSLTPLSPTVYLLDLHTFEMPPALASVLSISGHSISAVAPDHILIERGVSAWANAA